MCGVFYGDKCIHVRGVGNALLYIKIFFVGMISQLHITVVARGI